ncbi:Multimeric flavodoxin WrbA [Desulfacinum hydrothermale DSM 13146]|uniref:Multimeric flavodoxin WrbA n=1 Tax=Desulfacinum hydrothermale DSM 13146 TaxID=1121390 RepID=A0A1W1X9V2_9BACT|nr:flavodoxin family protein [Desulfacinum hydrothermale]SMC20607.1 Multimeric flavodoxin WrbA [Desulfacinum hydrothermale DSM 13146]
MATITALYGSPRKDGNTALLLRKALEGARQEGARVEEFYLRDLKISPCLELYGCKEGGRCVIDDDFHQVADAIRRSQGVILASPVFFYTVSAHTKIFMDRCQSLWVKRYWIDGTPFGSKAYERRGFFIAAGATRGKKLFDGVVLTARYFFDALGADLWDSLLVRGVDAEGDVLQHPEHLKVAHEKGKKFARLLREA